MYINGLPGTGKTVSVMQTLRMFSKKFPLPSSHVVYLNAMMLNTSSVFFSRLCKEFGLKIKRGVTPLNTFRNAILNSDSIFVLVLDEIDFLPKNILRTIFDLADPRRTMHTRLCLIGIANSLDLTMAADIFAAPRTLQFAAYSAEQLASILRARLRALSCEVIDAKSVEFLCRRAAKSGDARFLLDVCRYTIAQKLGRTDVLLPGASSSAAAADAVE